MYANYGKASMNKYLCKVADVFQVTGRLIVVADTLYDDFDKEWRHGAEVELRRADGSCIKTKSWHESKWPSNWGRPMSFSVENSLTKEDIPCGTEVWLVQPPVNSQAL